MVWPQRGGRPALPLSRLEIRRDRPVHRRAIGAAGKRFLPEGQAEILSAGEARAGAVDLYGTAGEAAAAAGMGIRHGSVGAGVRVQAPAGVQLATSYGRRYRFEPRFVFAPRRPRV